MSDDGKATLWEIGCAVLLGLILIMLMGGCASVPRIQFGKAFVEAPKDAGTPATLKSGEVKTGFRIPANSRVAITKTEAAPATADTPARPATEVLTFDFSQASEFIQNANTMQASTGTVDTSVAKKRIDVESKAPLLWACIGAGLLGAVALAFSWPTVAALCGGASALFFAAWRIADVPWWVGVIALAIAGGLFVGWLRRDANGDGIPDRLQTK